MTSDFKFNRYTHWEHCSIIDDQIINNAIGVFLVCRVVVTYNRFKILCVSFSFKIKMFFVCVYTDFFFFLHENQSILDTVEKMVYYSSVIII